MENKLHFEFTVEEANKVIGALAQMPYGSVAELIANIQKQAQSQINSSRSENEFTLSSSQ